MEQKISIIIPAYNLEHYLGATLDSVLAQTYRNIEIIVVNDGSQDGTRKIIDDYAAYDNRIVAIHKENGGVTSARLRGVAEASGDWIGFVDGDDYVEPHMYERLLSNAVKYGADIAHCGYQMVFPNGRIDYYYNTGNLVQQDRLTALHDLISGAFVEPGLVNKLFRVGLFAPLLQQKVIPLEIKINEDLLMNYYLFKGACVSIYEDICPYHYVLRKGSAATSKLSEHHLWDPMKVTWIMMEDNVKELQPVVFEKMIRQLIGGATRKLGEQPELIKPYRTHCKRDLRQRLWRTLMGKACSTQLKIMALWTAVWPASYRWIHGVYTQITGLDKKYDLD